MSTLYVIRHGQASFGKADYDVLSPLGIEQARRLGEWFAASGPRLDAVYMGPRRRQRDTAAHLIASGGMAHEAQLHEGLDEYPAEVIIRQTLPQLMERDPEVAELFAGDPMAQPADVKKFQRLFERVMQSWVRGDVVADGAMPFSEFAGRVRGALTDIMRREGRGRTVAVVTSGGPTAISVQLGLGLTDEMAMRTSWVVANSSLTELRWKDDVCTLIAFNTLPHLRERSLITYR